MITLGTIVSRIAELRDQMEALPVDDQVRMQLSGEIADLEEVATRLMGGDPLTTVGFDGTALFPRSA